MTKKKSKQQQKEQKLFAASTIGRPAEVCKRCGKVVESSLVGEIAKFFVFFFFSQTTMKLKPLLMKGKLTFQPCPIQQHTGNEIHDFI